MGPVFVVIGFVVLLALLLYYMYKEKLKGEAPPEEPRTESAVIEVRDYEAMLAAKKPATLIGKLLEVNEIEGLVKKLPQVDDVEVLVERTKEQSL